MECSGVFDAIVWRIREVEGFESFGPSNHFPEIFLWSAFGSYGQRFDVRTSDSGSDTVGSWETYLPGAPVTTSVDGEMLQGRHAHQIVEATER